MEIENNQSAVVVSDRKSIVLSIPGKILTTMTSELLPFAQLKKITDDKLAAPHYAEAMRFYADKFYEQARTEFLLAAGLGHGHAQFMLGTIYLEGLGIEKDYQQAYYWFHRTAEQGDSGALNKLGWMCEAGLGVERDQSRAVNWFRQAAERGHLEAQFNLGAKYDNGEGVSQNHSEAARWYRLSAEQGFSDARFFLAQALESGEGVPINFDEAIDWYILAAEKGHRSAKVKLWGYALKEKYRPEDEEEQIFIEKLGVEMKSALAEFKLAYRLNVGDGIEQNLEKSIDLYQSSANKGFGPAINHLSIIYMIGRGVEKNIAMASVLKTKELRATSDSRPLWMYLGNQSLKQNEVVLHREHLIKAEHGILSAMIKVGESFYYGKGVMQNYHNALTWRQRSADLGDSYSTYISGHMHLYGLGTAKSSDIACQYLRKAIGMKDLGDSVATTVAGLLINFSKNKREFMKLLKKIILAAETGDVDAQFKLGYLYSQSEFLKDFREEAAPWYVKAAAQGSSVAMYNLGILHAYGNGVSIDTDKAVEFYKQSALAGFKSACELLAELYAVGRYVQSDKQESFKWKAKAEAIVDVDTKVTSDEINLLSLGNTSRRQRLAEKRALQKKASDFLN
jgi:TPR repeat protein